MANEKAVLHITNGNSPGEWELVGTFAFHSDLSVFENDPKFKVVNSAYYGCYEEYVSELEALRRQKIIADAKAKLTQEELELLGLT